MMNIVLTRVYYSASLLRTSVLVIAMQIGIKCTKIASAADNLAYLLLTAAFFVTLLPSVSLPVDNFVLEDKCVLQGCCKTTGYKR